MTRISVFGGTGYAGGNIARVAAGRGHQVTSYTRTLPSDGDESIEFRSGSLFEPAVVAAVAEGSDVIVIALHGSDPAGPQLIEALPELASAAITHGVRVGVVGGAGSSLVAEGGPRLVDTPEFHAEWKTEALAHAGVLEWLRGSGDQLDWFYVSPAALFGSYAPGEATGTYRTDGDLLVTKPDGSSEISGADYALAFVDEIDHPQHRRQRFTVGH